MEPDIENINILIESEEFEICDLKDIQCSICLTEKINNMATLPCKHQFCTECILKNIITFKKYTCPNCNQYVINITTNTSGIVNIPGIGLVSFNRFEDRSPSEQMVTNIETWMGRHSIREEFFYLYIFTELLLLISEIVISLYFYSKNKIIFSPLFFHGIFNIFIMLLVYLKIHMINFPRCINNQLCSIIGNILFFIAEFSSFFINLHNNSNMNILSIIMITIYYSNNILLLFSILYHYVYINN